MIMKKYLSVLLLMLLVGGLVLAPVTNVFAEDGAKSTETDKSKGKEKGKKKGEEEPECD